MTESLKLALDEAMAYAAPFIEMECGGVILKSKEADEYKFIPLLNKHKDTAKSAGLYEVDRTDFGKQVIPLLTSGYNNYASFHTHPIGCDTNPSSIDFTKLFKGFPTNFIFSPSTKALSQYDFVPGTTMEEIFGSGKGGENTLLFVENLEDKLDGPKIESAWNLTKLRNEQT